MDLRHSPALQRFLADHPDEATQALVANSLRGEMRALGTHPPGPDRATEVHRRVDEAMEAFFARRPALRAAVRCHKGCHHCCRMWVGVTRDEVALLADRVRRGDLAPRMDALERQHTWQPGDYALHPPEEGRCCLLDTQGACLAYEVRPAACRAVLVTSDPSLCRDATTSTQITAIINPFAEIPRSAALSLEPTTRSLAQGLWEALSGQDTST